MIMPRVIGTVTDFLIIVQIIGVIMNVVIGYNINWWVVFSPAILLSVGVITTIVFCFMSNIIRVYIEDNIYLWRRSKKFYINKKRKAN